MPVLGRLRGGPADRRGGFTILELQMALVVLVAGLFTMSSLLSVQSKQMTRTETWCRSGPTYYVVSQSNPWMRRLGASAELKTQAGQESWAPPVSGTVKYEVLLDSWDANSEEQVGNATVTLQLVE
ncbi:MAG: hypothetical protein WBF17_14550 [Phycisphaerae bacterium]